MHRPRFLLIEAGDTGGGGSGGTGSPTLLGGAGSPAPAPGSGTPAPSTSTWLKDDSGGFADGWHDRLEGDLKGHASLRTLGSVGDLAKAYVETKKLVGTRLEAPHEKSTPEQVANWRKTVGCPEKPEGYLGDAKTLRPESIPESAWSAESEKAFLGIAHKHHLSPSAVKDIIAFHGASVDQGLKANDEGFKTYQAAQMGELQKAWGADFDSNLALAGRVAATAGLSKDDPIFNDAAVVQAFGKLGKLFSETSLVAGTPSSSASGGVEGRIKEITDPSSSAMVAREYRGEFGAERQAQAADAYRSLLKAKMEVGG